MVETLADGRVKRRLHYLDAVFAYFHLEQTAVQTGHERVYRPALRAELIARYASHVVTSKLDAEGLGVPVRDH